MSPRRLRPWWYHALTRTRELRGKLMMGDNYFIPLQDSMNILGVEVDPRLLSDRHLEDMA